MITLMVWWRISACCFLSLGLSRGARSLLVIGVPDLNNFEPSSSSLSLNLVTLDFGKETWPDFFCPLPFNFDARHFILTSAVSDLTLTYFLL